MTLETNRQRLMDRACIPLSYREDCVVKEDLDGNVNFYFGGLGSGDGFGHAHVSMDSCGHITYNRDVFAEHGAQNYTDFIEQSEQFRRMKHPKWDPTVEWGVLDSSDKEVTIKTTYDEDDILIARGFVKDIQRDVDHAHAWQQKRGEPRHHDTRWTDPLFPEEDG